MIPDARSSAPAQGEGGTVDSGRDATAITVCSGSIGDPSAVPIIDWKYYAFGAKYALPVGAKTGTEEPIYLYTNGTIVTGTVDEESPGQSSSVSGGGPFHSVGGISARGLGEVAMPETYVALTSDKSLGWSDKVTAFYSAATELAVDGWREHYRVAGRGAHFSNRTWAIRNPKRAPNASDSDYFAARIWAVHGMGWLFTVVFDTACKATAFDALVGNNPLDILDPQAPHTRAELSQFLVDNNARLVLQIFTTGDSDPGITAALSGTKASAATLDDLETTMTTLIAAIDANMQNVGPADYASVIAGTNPSWVIGEVAAFPVSSIP